MLKLLREIRDLLASIDEKLATQGNVSYMVEQSARLTDAQVEQVRADFERRVRIMGGV